MRVIYIDTRPVATVDPDFNPSDAGSQTEVVKADGTPRRLNLKSIVEGRQRTLSYFVQFCDANGDHVADAGTYDAQVIRVDTSQDPPVLGEEVKKLESLESLKLQHLTGFNSAVVDVRVTTVNAVAATHYKLHVIVD